MQTLKAILVAILASLIGTVASCTFMGGVIRYVVVAASTSS